MKVAVTGATGHLGRHLVHHLAASGHDVAAFSRSGAVPALPFGSSEPRSSVRALAVDLQSDAAVARLAPELGADVAVVHLAAWHPPATASTGPAERRTLLEVNVHGTLRLLEAVRRAGGARCVVYASTFEVYAELEGGQREIHESWRRAPRTDYGATKLAGEDHCLVFADEENVRTVSLRMPAVYGPGESTPRALPNFLHAVAHDRRPTVHGDGGDLRDQLHVRDAAAALALAIDANAVGAYNVADGALHSIAELARTAMELADMAGAPETKPRVKPRCDYHMSIERARLDLGFTPRVALRAGMAEQLAWIRAGD
jgi:nucleoside-diphosphate-sugar epimerase